MTPANVVTPAVGFPESAATAPTAEAVFEGLKDNLIITRATLEGVYALMQASEHTEACMALGSAQILLRNGMAQLRSIYDEIDLANLREFCKNGGAA
jgi:hypothetical protein